MKLLLASNNQHKVEELRAILLGVDPQAELLTLADLGDLQLDVEETGSTLEENAYLKARAFYELSGLPCIADDTGLEVAALNGAPGVRTSRYAGENASYADNVSLLLKSLQGIEDNQRQANFRTVICYVDELRTVFAEGVCRGHIATEARGSAGFGYDPVFIPDGYTETFAELSSDVKNTISHRARALSSFAQRYALLRDSSESTLENPSIPLQTSEQLFPVRSQLCRAAVHAVLNNQQALRSCIEQYCEHEHDLSLLYECLLQIYLFAGFPASLEALTTMRAVLSERGISWYADDSELYDLQRFSTRGTLTCQRIYTSVYTAMRERVGLLSAHVDQWMIVEGYGKVLSRAQLDLVSRELINVAVLAGSGWERQLYSHLRGALNVGAELTLCELALSIAGEYSSPQARTLAASVWQKVLSSTRNEAVSV